MPYKDALAGRKYKAQWAALHPEAMRASRTKWRLSNPDYWAKYYSSHAEIIRSRAAEWNKTNRIPEMCPQCGIVRMVRLLDSGKGKWCKGCVRKKGGFKKGSLSHAAKFIHSKEDVQKWLEIREVKRTLKSLKAITRNRSRVSQLLAEV